MVVLFVQTPRRGVVAMVNYAPPPLIGRVKGGYCQKENYNSKKEEMTATPTNGHSCFPFAVNCRFDKTFFGVPKKCGYCMKMVYGTGFACQNCRFRCHKRCVMLNPNTQPYLRQKVCSLSRLPGGGSKHDEEYDKVVKELINKCEINCNNYDDDDVFRERKSSDHETYNLHSLYRYPSSPPLSLASGTCSSNMQSSLETINEQPQTQNVCHESSTPGMVRRFLNFLPWNKLENQPSNVVVAAQLQQTPSLSSRKSSVTHMRVPELKSCASEPGTMSLRPLDLSFTSSGGQASGHCSPLIRTPVDEFNSIVLEEIFNQQKTRQQLQRKLKWVNHIVGDRGAYSQDCVTADSATSRCSELCKNGRTATTERGHQSSMNSAKINNDKLVASWPLPGLHMNLEDDTAQHAEHCNDDACCFDEDLRKRDSRVSELGEWTIPYGDLEFGESVLETRTMKIYKGRWHGDVMIHSYNLGENNHLISGFLDDVRTFTKIRHENVALFMGASIEAPLLAVVTSVRKGDSLYEAIFVKQKKLTQHTKVAVARQIAQGMSYLHAKGIVLKSLTSKSIYLECKVKISMVDSGAPLKQHDRFEKGCVRRGHLTYWSPELIRTLRVAPPALVVDVTKATKECDVFAFGTIMYEMFAGEFPFAQITTEATIWHIGKGIKQRLADVGCSTSLKSLIDVCWSHDPSTRPPFMSIFTELQHTAALNKRHSSSMPENLNKTGTILKYSYYQ